MLKVHIHTSDTQLRMSKIGLIMESCFGSNDVQERQTVQADSSKSKLVGPLHVASLLHMQVSQELE